MARIFIGVGSNINPEKNVLRAVSLLAEDVRLRAVSTFYRTEPIERPEQPHFYNGIVEIETDLDPRELKTSILRKIEKELGRRRSDDKYAARTIDLDILAYDDAITNADEVVSRPFVAIPLYELAPGLSLPQLGVTLAQIAAGFAEHEMQALPRLTELLRKETTDGL